MPFYLDAAAVDRNVRRRLWIFLESDEHWRRLVGTIRLCAAAVLDDRVLPEIDANINAAHQHRLWRR